MLNILRHNSSSIQGLVSKLSNQQVAQATKVVKVLKSFAAYTASVPTCSNSQKYLPRNRCYFNIKQQREEVRFAFMVLQSGSNRRLAEVCSLLCRCLENSYWYADWNNLSFNLQKGVWKFTMDGSYWNDRWETVQRTFSGLVSPRMNKKNGKDGQIWEC